MSAQANTRLLWLGVVVVASLAATSVWCRSSPTGTQEADKASVVNEEASPPPALQRTPRRLPRHRSPEDDVSIDALRDLLSHPSYAIRAAATRLVLTRLVRHRLFVLQYRRYLSCRLGADDELAMQFRRSMTELETCGWAGKTLGDGEMQIEAVPEGVWEGLVRGYSGWDEDWERRYGMRVESHRRVGTEGYSEDVDLVGVGKL